MDTFMDNFWVNVIIRLPDDNKKVDQIDINNPKGVQTLADVVRDFIHLGYTVQIQRTQR